MGLATVAVLCVLDAIGTVVVGSGQVANVSGTLALAPALTAVGGSRRQSASIAGLALLAAVVLVWSNDVSLVPGAVRCAVVAVAGVVATAAAGVRARQVAQLQDRRQAAQTLQAAMLTALPQPDHLHLASRYRAATTGDQVGGDWYDAFLDAHGALTLVLGDVVGHDITAAATMGQVRATLRACAVTGSATPAQVLTVTEGALAQLGVEVLATAVVVRVEQDRPGSGQRRLRWSSAGHPPPILVDAQGRSTALECEPGPPLGVGLGLRRSDCTSTLPPRATLLLYSDGLVERRDSDLDAGLARLQHAAAARARHPLDALLDGVLGDLLGRDQFDDVALLALRAYPEDAPRPRDAGPEVLPAEPQPLADVSA